MSNEVSDTRYMYVHAYLFCFTHYLALFHYLWTLKVSWNKKQQKNRSMLSFHMENSTHHRTLSWVPVVTSCCVSPGPEEADRWRRPDRAGQHCGHPTHGAGPRGRGHEDTGRSLLVNSVPQRQRSTQVSYVFHQNNVLRNGIADIMLYSHII